MTAWTVGFADTAWTFANQFVEAEPLATEQHQCAAACVSMTLASQAHLDLSAEEVRAYLGGTGDLTTGQIEQALWHFGQLASHTEQPTAINGDGGLLRYEWSNLVAGRPLIWRGAYRDTSGVYHPDIPHFRVVIRLDDSYAYSADPASGGVLQQSYAEHWATFLGWLIVIDPSTPPALPHATDL